MVLKYARQSALLERKSADALALAFLGSVMPSSRARRHNEHVPRCELVQLLIESKADIDVRNNEGRTPLEEASVKGHEGVIQLLLKYGGEEDGV